MQKPEAPELSARDVVLAVADKLHAGDRILLQVELAAGEQNAPRGP